MGTAQPHLWSGLPAREGPPSVFPPPSPPSQLPEGLEKTNSSGVFEDGDAWPRQASALHRSPSVLRGPLCLPVVSPLFQLPGMGLREPGLRCEGPGPGPPVAPEGPRTWAVFSCRGPPGCDLPAPSAGLHRPIRTGEASCGGFALKRKKKKQQKPFNA